MCTTEDGAQGQRWCARRDVACRVDWSYFVDFGHYFVLFGTSSKEFDLSGPFCKRCEPISRDRIVTVDRLLERS